MLVDRERRLQVHDLSMVYQSTSLDRIQCYLRGSLTPCGAQCKTEASANANSSPIWVSVLVQNCWARQVLVVSAFDRRPGKLRHAALHRVAFVAIRRRMRMGAVSSLSRIDAALKKPGDRGGQLSMSLMKLELSAKGIVFNLTRLTFGITVNTGEVMRLMGSRQSCSRW